MTGTRPSGRKLTVFLHLAVWATLLASVAYLVSGGSQKDRGFLQEIGIQFLFYAIIFYLCYLLLIPRLYFAGRKRVFFLTAGLLIGVLTVVFGVYRSGFRERHEEMRRVPAFSFKAPGSPDEMRNRPDPPPRPMHNWPLFNFILTSCLVTGLSLGLRVSEKLIRNEQLRKEAEEEKLNAELAFLKHQINPHFLFNTLNSIYSLALVKSDLTAEAVMKLSDMMRYVIQEAGHDRVPLDLELDYVRHYVELQKMRLSSKVDVQMDVPGNELPWLVPPMILVLFVENAFKHGTSAHEDAIINIRLETDNGMLTWTVTNPIFHGREKPETFGVGIQNTRKRLGLIYPGRHTLEISETGDRFVARLSFPLE